MVEEKHPEPTDQPQKENTGESQLSEATPPEYLQAELDEARRERSQFKSLAQRAQADLVNFRKRVEDEKDELYRTTAARLITKMLPILDDLQRALDRLPANAEEAGWLEGIRIIERNLRFLLQSEGVTPIEAAGKPFDPWEHEALFGVEDTNKEEGTVVTVIRPGYKLNGKVLRTAQVAVAQEAITKTQGTGATSQTPASDE